MQKSCQQCQKNFEITDNDQKFYTRVHVSAPTLCPACRSQRRMAFRNERNLYQRKCDLTGKQIISVYSKDIPFPVYDHEAWHGDKWDAMKYERDYDFNRPFFEQFAELYLQVPRINFMNSASENSDYANYAFRNKNCYLIFGSHYNEDCQYANYIWKDTNCTDCLEALTSELVYEGVYSSDCYSCQFIEYCFNCNDCAFCYDMIGCKNCLFSSNLRNKQYYIFNKPASKEEYEKTLADLKTGSYSHLAEHIKKYMEVRKNAIKRNMFQKNCENCLGSDIQNSKNIYRGFNIKYIEDCSYLDTQNTHVKDGMDLTCTGYDPSEVIYECIGNSGNNHVLFCNSCWHNNDIFYCEQVLDSQNCFGCIGLKHKQYCILNKQYSKEEYESMMAKIYDHMASTKEWGEFFPATISQFAYNETVAQIYFPLTKEQALSRGYKWRDPDPKEYRKQTYETPDDISEAPDAIVNEILACHDCGKNYKITTPELAFYRRSNLPIPRYCPDCRHRNRMNQKTPRQLFDTSCKKCGTVMKSVYPADSGDTVYCEKCYLEALN